MKKVKFLLKQMLPRKRSIVTLTNLHKLGKLGES